MATNREQNTGKSSPQHHGAHSGIRKGLSDYNDGANVTDQLGNDDEIGQFGIFESGTSAENLEGKVAYGNDVEETEDENEKNDSDRPSSQH